MRISFLLLASLVTALLAGGAHAQTATGNPNTSPPGPKQADCSQARNPEHCAARQQARTACKDKKGAAFRQCVDDAMPAPDCSKARNPQRCEAHEQARQSCKGKVGREHKQCMHDALAPKK